MMTYVYQGESSMEVFTIIFILLKTIIENKKENVILSVMIL